MKIFIHIKCFMQNSTNQLNNEQKEIRNESWQRLTSFSEENYYSKLSEISEENNQQKQQDNLKFEELKNRLQIDDDLISEIIWKEISINDLSRGWREVSNIPRERLEKIRDNKELIIGITWKEISINDLSRNWIGVSYITKRELEKIRDNKELIIEITWEEISFHGLGCFWKSLWSIKKEGLENIRENKNLILEIIWKEKIEISDLENSSNITKEELEKIKENKELIIEITWKEISFHDLGRDWRVLSNITKEELEKIKENKELIIEITWKEISLADLHFYKRFLSEIEREELEKIKENKELIQEIIWKGISLWDLSWHHKELSDITKEEIVKIRDNKNSILEIIWEETIKIYMLRDLSNLRKEDLERIRENKSTILEITWEKRIVVYDLHNLIDIRKEDLERIRENKSTIIEITWWKKIKIEDLKSLIGITKEKLKRIKENESLILEIKNYNNPLSFILDDGIKIEVRELNGLSRLTAEDLVKIKDISHSIGRNIQFFSDSDTDWILDNGLFGRLSKKKWYLKDLCQLDEESISYCNSKFIKELRMITMVDKIMKNSGKVRDYVKRKQEYTEKNSLIDNSEFEGLFWGIWKYGKWEIHQDGLWYCYLYTAYEILKKMNFFDELVKTNLKKSEDWDWWYVRLPMWQPDWQWIRVSKKEIDKKFDIPDKEMWLREWVSVNSDSPLWFKIMEIAYIKKELMDRRKDIKQEYDNTWDVVLTGERLYDLEWYDTIFALSTLIWDDPVVNRNVRKTDNRYKDMIFDNFKQWLIVDLSVKQQGSENREIRVNRHWKIKAQIIERDVRIINNEKNIDIVKSGIIKEGDNTFNVIDKNKRTADMLSDVINEDGDLQVVFYRKHAYSLERCYIDKDTWEKRVRIVNPWYTWIKFDISLESAKKIFNWIVAYIDIDKLFR